MRLTVRWLILAAWLIGSSVGVAEAQSESTDSARAEIQRTLRSFYFNLAHDDWEAMTADILAAKVVAHRPAPGALIAAGHASGSSVRIKRIRCSAREAPDPNGAIIVFNGDWAGVTVPRCGAGQAGADEFRLIRFEERWRFVYIDLFDEPVNVSTGR